MRRAPLAKHTTVCREGLANGNITERCNDAGMAACAQLVGFLYPIGFNPVAGTGFPATRDLTEEELITGAHLQLPQQRVGLSRCLAQRVVGVYRWHRVYEAELCQGRPQHHSGPAREPWQRLRRLRRRPHVWHAPVGLLIMHVRSCSFTRASDHAKAFAPASAQRLHPSQRRLQVRARADLYLLGEAHELSEMS